MKAKLGGRTWAALLTFGLVGQIAWVIENMYFNVFLYNTISGDTSMIAAMVAWSAVTATVTTLVMGALSDRLGRRKAFIVAGYLLWGVSIGAFALIKSSPVAAAAHSAAVLVVVLVVALTQLINHTRIGMAMRAVSRDFETAQLMGIRINSVISVTFIIGSLLAAIGSLLYFTNYQSIVPLSGSLPGLRAFVAAVFGGIGSIPGAVVGAFLIGICESVIKGSDWSVFSDAFTFALLIVVLCVKPTGLFGEKVTDKV